MTQTASSRPVLIYDKHGLVGMELAKSLSKASLVLFVSRSPGQNENVVPIFLDHKIPSIPDNLFSKIIIFYSGEKELHTFLPSFVSKAKDSHAPIIFVVSIFTYTEDLARRLLSFYENTHVVVIGDVFTENNATLSTPTPLLLHEAMKGKILLTNEGLDLLYPVFLQDVIYCFESLLVNLQDGAVYAILPHHPITQLSFVRLLQKHHHIAVDYAQKPIRQQAYILPSSAIPLLDASYPLEQRLRKVQFSEATERPVAKNGKKVKKKQQALNKSRIIVLAVALIFFTLSLPLLLSVIFASAGGLALRSVESSLNKGQLSQAFASSEHAATFFSVADQSSLTLEKEMSLIGLGGRIDDIRRLISSGKEISLAAKKILSSATVMQEGFASKKGLSKTQYLQVINELKQAILSLQTLQAEDALPKVYAEKLSVLQKPLGLLGNLIAVSPQILGYDRQMNYLILFQNNFELRPTGGFIGSYGILSLRNGKILSFSVRDVYDADGKLTADIDPPFALKRYMGASHWFLRDSNFSIDFPTSANQAASFLKLETGEKVDGVVGIDVSLLEALLSVTGPVKVADYNETVHKENFYILTEKYVQEDFFPGSTQKKDFLRAFERSLTNTLIKGNFSYQQFGAVLTQAVFEKHILFAFSDTHLQELFSVNNISASLLETRKKQKTNVLDTIGINEANIGQNKANFYLKRDINQLVEISGEGELQRTITVSLRNLSTDTSQFGGDYKAYLRLIAPSSARLLSMKIDNKEQQLHPAVINPLLYGARNFREKEGVEVQEETIGGIKTFGVYIAVPKSQKKAFTFRLDLGKIVPVELEEWTYNLKVIKQPGTLADPHMLTVHYPINSKLVSFSGEAADLGGKIVIEEPLLQDLDYVFSFSRKQ